VKPFLFVENREDERLGKFREGLFDDTEEFGANESWVSGLLPIGWDARRAILRGGTPGGV